MNEHLFIFQMGIWLGEGTITFPRSHDTIKFFTRWKVVEQTPGKVVATQEVELLGVGQTLINIFTFLEIKRDTFRITLENESMGKVSGKGVIDEKIVAWELRNPPGFEGYEIYTIQKNGDYTFSAEYASDKDYSSHIQGRIWRKVPDS